MTQPKTLAGAHITAVCDVYEPRILQAAEIAVANVTKVTSSGDGSVSHLQNWLDCIRSRKTPNATSG